MHPRVFLVANHFLVEIKTRGACDAREHENCTNGTLGEGTHSVGDTGFAHLALGVVKKKERKTKCGGDRYAPSNKSLHTKNGASSALLKKRKRKKKKNKRERERNKAK